MAIKIFTVFSLFFTVFGFFYFMNTPEPEDFIVPAKTRITILAGQSTSDAGVEDMIKEKLSQEFPDIEVEWESVPWDDFTSAMQAKIASGEDPDLMIGKALDVYTYQPRGDLMPLPLVVTKQIQQEGLKAVEIQGEYYGAPYNLMYHGVFYNRDIFERYNIKIPETIEEMHQTVKKLEAVGITPFAVHTQENWAIINLFMQFATNCIFVDDPVWGDKFRNGEENFSSSKKAQNCIFEVAYVLNHSWSDAASLRQYECDQRFANGKAAMYITGSWSLQTIAAVQPTMRVGIFPYPNSSGTAKLIMEPNLTFMKNARSKNSELVDQMLSSIFSDETLAEDIYHFTKSVPLRKETSALPQQEMENDILLYKKRKQVIDATISNRQLLWPYQNKLAEKINLWTVGKLSFSNILQYADEQRMKSGRLLK